MEMNSRSKSNPWIKNNSSQSNRKIPKNVFDPGPKPLLKASERKFKEAHQKFQDSVQKHLKDYDSSSEEEYVDPTDVIDVILKNYRQGRGSNDQVTKTETFIEEAFLSGTHTCLICISRIKRDDEIWSCSNCYGSFHLLCIQRWSKDTITQQKQSLEEQSFSHRKPLSWCCPKCRFEYEPENIPSQYLCFCGKIQKPKYDPFLIPHSCGAICKKGLVPTCGHKCLLLCHPGPCPPCPVTVSVSCFCGSQPPVTQRCSHKGWSCGNRCDKTLSCGKHNCPELCHPGECKPCSKKSIQKCMCQSQQKLRDCASPVWQCDKICGKLLDCGNHRCQEVCHGGVCESCALSKPRTCPCGKEKYILPCTDETPTCKDTCGKLLECGIHFCNQRCHKEKCGLCLETVIKACRCGQYSKEIQCSKQYLCDTKCKRIRDCNKHPCNRKCCDGNCPPCEKVCGHTLQCGNHKCASVCHRGLCYPCQQTNIVTCRCGATKITVPCGKKHKTKPPRCSKLCLIPPDCHHETRESHRCHFGDCPACKQVCNKRRSTCEHLCLAQCHSAVLVKLETERASMPWEQSKPQLEKRELQCPDCIVPVMVTCLGEHETSSWPCHLAKPSCCGRPCGRMLACSNHFCSVPCHVVDSVEDNKVKAGTNCEKCENPCMKARPDGCQHSCLNPCHPGECPPCKQMLRIKCHCGLNQPYIKCSDWLDLVKREELQSCGNQCPKNYACGHRCKANCHSGKCPNSDSCKKKLKVTCKCKRIKKEFSCESVRRGVATIDCDDGCAQKQKEEQQKQDELDKVRKLQEEIKNQRELEKYEKIFAGKRKTKERKKHEENEEKTLFRKYWMLVLSSFLVVASVAVYQVVG
ncbi:NF-X1-type zinc finger protein NFXL1 [Cylas formicarius]|uniref:NF-X1-type zinc finger protein NFXL1 n=1 Tax=Cylas formicarius TaxID=197179 RepID=UPI002958B34C|nr:NF-X1-type zinc finger protein NFXL1 [Cylas formicarius]XP_060521137.1 NF-X1-type zinc finger protein NFXL1 [Cylas formicarius]